MPTVYNAIPSVRFKIRKESRHKEFQCFLMGSAVRRWGLLMRKLGIVILAIVVLLVAAVLIVPHLININDYHNQIQAQLQKRLGRQVTLGNMSLSLIPPSF